MAIGILRRVSDAQLGSWVTFIEKGAQHFGLMAGVEDGYRFIVRLERNGAYVGPDWGDAYSLPEAEIELKTESMKDDTSAVSGAIYVTEDGTFLCVSGHLRPSFVDISSGASRNYISDKYVYFAEWALLQNQQTGAKKLFEFKAPNS